ncbi:Sugar phosphate exchanger 2 [Fasciola gigantica]|uniref:Sugar phosphate exchanger 2 n=1 Tax=Fasciola gigantica TaxID=46835 RepID=A0A504YRZ5_FASGI|nr:Sugar phosphate exchanger 2 [Fasciola gigantica]
MTFIIQRISSSSVSDTSSFLSSQNVLAYSVLLFFAKLVSYTFLYWLPNYLAVIEANRVNAEQAANLSVLFDLGGIVGGVLAGLLSDSRNPKTDNRIIWRRSVTCAVMLLLAAPSVSFFV